MERCSGTPKLFVRPEMVAGLRSDPWSPDRGCRRGLVVSTRLVTRTMELTVSGKTSANETQASQGSQTQCEGTRVRSALVQNYDSARDESDASNPIGSDLYLARLKPG